MNVYFETDFFFFQAVISFAEVSAKLLNWICFLKKVKNIKYVDKNKIIKVSKLGDIISVNFLFVWPM